MQRLLALQQCFRTFIGPKEVSPTLPDWLMGSWAPAPVHPGKLLRGIHAWSDMLREGNLESMGPPVPVGSATRPASFHASGPR